MPSYSYCVGDARRRSVGKSRIGNRFSLEGGSREEDRIPVVRALVAVAAVAGAHGVRFAAPVDRACGRGRGARRGRRLLPGAPLRAPARLAVPAARGRRDRKSTRLNSSHVKISYAVFCLTERTASGRR